MTTGGEFKIISHTQFIRASADKAVLLITVILRGTRIVIRLPYYRKLTLVLIKVLEINAT